MNHPIRIAIIGGGAAGLFAAITAKRKFPDTEVTVFEKNSKLLAKVAITGGGRCNLTNTFEEITDLKYAYPRGHKLLKRLFCSFDHHSICRWFEQEGVALTIQEDQCVFPASQDSMSIVGCLISAARQAGVRFRIAHRLKAIEPTADGLFTLAFDRTDTATAETVLYRADRVAVTTGGAPRLQELAFLAPIPHHTAQPVPSLFTLNIADKDFTTLTGTVVSPVTVSIPSTKFRADGPLLVTHWGASGPAILKLSSYAAHHLHDCNYFTTIAINWAGTGNRDRVEQELRALIDANSGRHIGNIRPYGLPARLWLHLLSKACCLAEKRNSELGKKAINRITELLTNDQYATAGKGVYKEEFVTCGGVALTDINPNTLESKVCPHLFFAGEVLDVDGITGGFNLQAAWTMGYTVGRHIGY